MENVLRVWLNHDKINGERSGPMKATQNVQALAYLQRGRFNGALVYVLKARAYMHMHFDRERVSLY